MHLFLRTPFVLQILVYPFTWVSLRFFARIRVLGRENMHGLSRGAIFAVNHSSELDPILVPATLSPFSRLMPMFYISRERSFYPRAQKGGVSKYFYGGFFFKLWGAYPALIGTGDYEIALTYHIKILERGKSVCTFPEGRKTRDGSLGEGKAGVAYLLWRTGVPVVPVAIRGHYQMGMRDFLARKHSIVVSYGVPITREELFGTERKTYEPPSYEELKTATRFIMYRIDELLKS